MSTWKNSAETGQIQDAIVQYVKENDYVSFPELQNVLAPYLETKGDRALPDPEYSQLIFWAGMSSEFVEAIRELIVQKQLYLYQASPLVHLADGMLLKFPIAKSRRPYKDVRWYPVTLRTISSVR